MSANWPELYRSVVMPAHCDHYGHMNVRQYAAFFDDAGWQLFPVLGLSLTGYLLPWDQKGFWATKVATNIAGTTPVIGPGVQRVIVGGTVKVRPGGAAPSRVYRHPLCYPSPHDEHSPPRRRPRRRRAA